MKELPKCSITGCENKAFILFGNQYICGLCLAKYDKALKKNQIKNLKEVLEL